MAPPDDYTHEVGPEINFNESMYFQFHDPDADVGGFLRLANRPNEGRGERTVCLYLPGGRVAFGFARPEVDGNESFDSAGLSFRVMEPFSVLEVTFAGEVSLLSDPSTLADPRHALSHSPAALCVAQLTFRGAAPAFAHNFDGDGESFAPHHYEQLMVATGTVEIGSESFRISGHGLRDHSWGPRSWQAPWFYRWLHGSADGFGFMGAFFGSEDGSSVCGGFVWDGQQTHICDGVSVTTTRDERFQQQEIMLELSSGDHVWSLQGRATTVVPLRHRARGSADNSPMTRIVEASTVWSGPGGVVLHGMSEYLDQIVDGLPVGVRY